MAEPLPMTMPASFRQPMGEVAKAAMERAGCPVAVVCRGRDCRDALAERRVPVFYIEGSVRNLTCRGEARLEGTAALASPRWSLAEKACPALKMVSFIEFAAEAACKHMRTPVAAPAAADPGEVRSPAVSRPVPTPAASLATRPAPRPPTEGAGGLYVAGILMAGAGTLAVVFGATFMLLDGEEARCDVPPCARRYDTMGLGIGMGLAGLAVAGVGIWAITSSPSSARPVAVKVGPGSLGLAGRF